MYGRPASGDAGVRGYRQLMIGIDDVRRAARRLEGVAHRTPAITSRSLDRLVGGQVLLKPEPLQRAGSFKFRGAYNKNASMLARRPLERDRCVLIRQSRTGCRVSRGIARNLIDDRDAHRRTGHEAGSDAPPR
jgi:hypothetical protein